MSTLNLLMRTGAVLILGGASFDQDTLDERLATLEQKLEAVRLEAHVPGMSIAIVTDDTLTLNVPGKGKVGLKQPDADEKWYATVTAAVAVSFTRATEGRGNGLIMHTNGFNLEVPLQGYTIIEAEADVRDLQRFVGAYLREEGGRHVELPVDEGPLTLTDRGNQLAFHAPDAEGRAPLFTCAAQIDPISRPLPRFSCCARPKRVGRSVEDASVQATGTVWFDVHQEKLP